MDPSINVSIIRVFEGERHDKLRALWDAYAEWKKNVFRLHWYANPGGRCHADCYNAMFLEEQKRPEPYSVFTEHDFLPDYDGFPDLSGLDTMHPVSAVMYATRNPATMKLVWRAYPGAWLVMMDKLQLKTLRFDGAKSTNDPGNGLADFVAAQTGKFVHMIKQVDDYPDSYGLKSQSGLHLFFSRHLHDNPYHFVAGFSVECIQKKHDAAVEKWIKNAPDGLKKCLAQQGISMPS